MKPLSFKRHRFPPEIIRYAIWLYARFTLSFRDVDVNAGWIMRQCTGVRMSH
jgi:transposase-like protein